MAELTVKNIEHIDRIKAALKKCGAKYKYIHFTKKSKKVFRPKLDAKKISNGDFKPHDGTLWLSYPELTNQNWIGWALHMLPDRVDIFSNDIIGFNLGKIIAATTTGKLPQSDPNAVLSLNSISAVKEFHEKYNYKPFKNKIVGLINWKQVAADWGGVEFRPYFLDPELRFNPEYLWYATLDVASVAVWNPEVISNYALCGAHV